MYYLAINELYKEFAIVEQNFAAIIADTQEEQGYLNVWQRKLHGNTNWDKLIEEYGARGYRYTTIDTYQEAIEFVTQ